MNSMQREKLQIRLRSLRRLYAEISEWSQDRGAAPRVLKALNPLAELMVIGEAVGPETLRCSGVNYFRLDGSLGRTGRYLDDIIRPLGFTVYPSSKIKLANGAVIESDKSKARKTVYCTDLCPEFPGYCEKGNTVKKSIKRPTLQRVSDALKQGFLERELALVKPKVILLLGSSAYISFYTHFLGRSELSTLREAVENLPTHLATYKTSLVIPFLHPSPANPYFQKWFQEFREAPMESAFIRCVCAQLKR
jgi:uracil-DNA glycosylase